MPQVVQVYVANADLFFLLMHPYMIAWVMENLKYMHSPRIIEAASEKAQDIFRERVTGVERVKYRFFIIKNEVQILAYSLRIRLVPALTETYPINAIVKHTATRQAHEKISGIKAIPGRARICLNPDASPSPEIIMHTFKTQFRLLQKNSTHSV